MTGLFAHYDTDDDSKRGTNLNNALNLPFESNSNGSKLNQSVADGPLFLNAISLLQRHNNSFHAAWIETSANGTTNSRSSSSTTTTNGTVTRKNTADHGEARATDSIWAAPTSVVPTTTNRSSRRSHPREVRPSNQGASPPLLVYFVHTTNESTFRPDHLRAIESVFFHHPDAHITLYVKNMTTRPIQPLVDAGYKIVVKLFKIRDMLWLALNQTSGREEILNDRALAWMARIDEYEATKNWITNESNLMRYLLLYLYGGIYLDTDMIVTKPLDDDHLPPNVIGMQDANTRSVNQAIMKFQPRNAFLATAINDFFRTFRPKIWGHNGPRLMTRLMKRKEFSKCTVPSVVSTSWATQQRQHNKSLSSSLQVASQWPSCPVMVVEDPLIFYPMHPLAVSDQCFNSNYNYTTLQQYIQQYSFTVHLNNKLTKDKWMSRQGQKPRRTHRKTLCHWLYNSFCVLCNTTV